MDSNNITSMEVVFYRLHVRFTTTVTRVLGPGVRRWMEFVILANAFLLAIVIICLHSRFVNRDDHCLADYIQRHDIDALGADVLSVRVVSFLDHGHPSLQAACLAPMGGKAFNRLTAAAAATFMGAVGIGGRQRPCDMTPHIPAAPPPDRVFLGDDSLFPQYKYHVERSYLFSLEKGYLMLRDELRHEHGIRSINLTVDTECQECFGDGVSRFLLRHIVGYDTVVTNWLISIFRGRGYVYTIQSKELFNLNYAADLLASGESWETYAVFKAGVVLTTLFLFFTTTTLVSFTLRETQERMLKFTYLLQHYVRNRLPYAPLVVTHVVESLVFVPIMVGVLLFLSEFFSDQLLAFMVLSMVWAGEVYSVISVRTAISVRFFPKIFFCYFVLFHIFFFSFPYGFSYLALMSIVAFLQHSMLFFWNRYEVPALQNGSVSPSNPRPAGTVIQAPIMEHLLVPAEGQGSHVPAAAAAATILDAALPSPSPPAAGPQTGREGAGARRGRPIAEVQVEPAGEPHEGIGSSSSSSGGSIPPSPSSPFSVFFLRRAGLYSSLYEQQAILGAAGRALMSTSPPCLPGETVIATTGVNRAASSNDDLTASWLFGDGGGGPAGIRSEQTSIQT